MGMKTKKENENEDVINKNIKVVYKQRDGSVKEFYITLLFFLTK
ncbi:MAG: hypothetical protein ACP5UN_01835 [Candidatus Micrarchaeia archaeon]